jgi:hypothetical protein
MFAVKIKRDAANKQLLARNDGRVSCKTLCAFEVSIFLFAIRTKEDFVRDFLIFV